VTTGAVLSGPLVSVNANTPGTLVVGLVSTKNSTKGGTLFSIPLTVMANPTVGSTAITIAAELNDKDANTVNATVGNDVLTVSM
jgi:hypothetical protein